MSPTHIVILVIVLIALFGSAKLPEIARNIGKSAKTLKAELSDLTEDTPSSSPRPASRENTPE